VEEYIATAERLMTNHPGFFVGFDFVGQEDLGQPLIEFADIIDAARIRNPDLNFFFHAGAFEQNINFLLCRFLYYHMYVHYYFLKNNNYMNNNVMPYVIFFLKNVGLHKYLHAYYVRYLLS